MSTNNIFCDLGNLLVSDANPINQEFINEEEIQAKALSNTKAFFTELYNLMKAQQGNDDENRDFDKEADNVRLPKGQLLLPRAKRIPKDKPYDHYRK